MRSAQVVSLLQQPAGTSVTTQVWGAPAAAPVPAASPPAGVDMATVGKGVGVSSDKGSMLSGCEGLAACHCWPPCLRQAILLRELMPKHDVQVVPALESDGPL